MGFSLGSLFGSKTPKYNMDQAVLSSNFGVESDLGNLSLKKNADGSYTKVYESSDIDKQKSALASQGLGALSLDPTDIQNAYYNANTSLLDKQFGQQRSDLDEQLINRGIQTGSDQYNKAMGNLTDAQNQTYQNIANNAVYQGYNTLGQAINNVNALTEARDIGTLAGMGGTNEAYNNYYNSKVSRANASDAMTGSLLQAGAIALAASDRRLKENLKPVGKLDNGLTVYVGNYKAETGLDTTPQLFLIAQEVEKVNPDAVVEVNGIKMVNYKEAVK